MNYTERIYDFLDGMLDTAEEAELLRLAADNAEIRDELRHAITLQTAFKADVRALTPPPALTQRIFSHVSAQRIPSAQSQSASVHAPSGVTTNTPLTAFVSSLITAIVLLSLNNAVSNKAINNEQSPNTTQTIIAAKSAFPLAYLRIAPANHNFERRNLVSNNAVKGNLPANNEHITSIGAALENVLASTDSSAANHSDAINSASTLAFSTPDTTISTQINDDFRQNAQSEYLQREDSPQARIQEPFEPITPPEKPEESFFGRIQVHARRIVSTSLPSMDFPSNPASFLRNTAIGALWKLSDHHAIGIELSEETYLQRFRARLSEGSPMLDIVQNPSLLWGGLAYRYTFFPDKAFSPFLHSVLGGTELGANGRVMLGLTYSPDERTQFQIGVESSALLYFHQNVLYASPKLGFTYGVSLRL
ncbi:MAG: hypothetical protein MUF71_20075 [Candidatus Kapabacteria bacterium]|jgi:hypothetical protein|nr:hypothetical protein [Candidatus Kapabacteria bacterium]